MTKKITLIDGSGFIFRAYHALPPLTRSDGTPVGAVYGFCNMLLKFLNAAEYDACVVVVFDSGRKTFRNDIYPEYKAHRPEAPEDLVPQFPLFRTACEAFDLPTIEQVGVEADDIIASFAFQAKSQGYEVVIISGDKDLMQLIDDHVVMIDPLKNKRMGNAEVMEKFGVTPSLVIDAQALIGDSSDNVPGVPSIGPKTAAELLNTYGSLDGIYENLEKIKQPKRRETLSLNKDKAYLSKRLVTLLTDVEIPPLSQFVRHTLDAQKVAAFLKAQDFKTLASRVLAKGAESTHENSDTHTSLTNISPKTRLSYPFVTSKENLEGWLANVRGTLCIDTETTGLDVRTAELVGIALAKYDESSDNVNACYIPLGHDVLEKQMSMEDARAVLRPFLENESILKVGHNLKYDLAILKKYDMAFETYDDTLLMSYALDGGRHRHNLDTLIKKYFDHDMITFKEVIGKQKRGEVEKTFRDIPLQPAADYAGEDAHYTFKLYEILKERLFKEKLKALYHHMDRPLLPVIASMEDVGIGVNPEILRETKLAFEERLAGLEEEIFILAGHHFNIASPQQMSVVLFEEMNLPKPKKNKTGAFTTEGDVLEDLVIQGIPIAEKILAWRSLSKLISTYTEGLINAISTQTKRIHTSFHMTGTTTGRLSSSNPNLQNIPIKTEDGLKIRSAFVASPGCVFVSFDYSQIELRLLAHMADIPSLKQAFKNGLDIHIQTASEIFHTSLDTVTLSLRSQAKAINFGIIYGISAFGLARQLKIERTDAQNYIDLYLKRYPGIAAYMEAKKNEARKFGYVTTLLGRHCFTPGILDKNYNVRQFAERQAINAPLQGTNADMMRRAMVEIFYKLKQGGYASQMLLQIHDELIFDMPEGEVEALIPLITKIMERILDKDTPLSLPLVVDHGIGKNWSVL